MLSKDDNQLKMFLLCICESFVIVKNQRAMLLVLRLADALPLTPLFLSDDIINGIDKNLVLVLLLFCEVVEGYDVGM